MLLLERERQHRALAAVNNGKAVSPDLARFRVGRLHGIWWRALETVDRAVYGGTIPDQVLARDVDGGVYLEHLTFDVHFTEGDPFGMSSQPGGGGVLKRVAVVLNIGNPNRDLELAAMRAETLAGGWSRHLQYSAVE